MDHAWITLALDDKYAIGACVLAASLRRVSKRQDVDFVILLHETNISSSIYKALKNFFKTIVPIQPLNSNDAQSLKILGRPELGITFSKITAWSLTQYSKAVFLDADTLALSNVDDLFERDSFSASPDPGWPDCFNSGVFVFSPSTQIFDDLLELSQTEGSFDGADQGLLNSYFKDWSTKDISKHLPFIYNMCASASYTYLPAYLKFAKDIKILHFIGPDKPWNGKMNGISETTKNHFERWSEIYNNDVLPLIEGSKDVFYNEQCEIIEEKIEIVYPAEDRRSSWEEGVPDYMGTASFDKITEKLEKSLKD